MNKSPGTKVTNSKEKENLLEVSLEEEPENPYENLGVIGECMWKWKEYFDWRKKKEKNNSNKFFSARFIFVDLCLTFCYKFRGQLKEKIW